MRAGDSSARSDGTGGLVGIYSGRSSATSSGNILLASADGGIAGSSGGVTVGTGVASHGQSGTILPRNWYR